MQRREFLIGFGATLLAPVVLAAVSGCGDGGASSTPAEGFTIGSSADAGPGGSPHSHTLRVLLADLENPPATGVTYTTITASGHTHLVTLAQADLAGIQAGATVGATTSVASGHQHTYSIRKP